MSKRDAPSRASDAREPKGVVLNSDTTMVLPTTALLATVLATGLAVMVVEILGTRIIGPVFGVSLYIWSALLAVTLASLASGYYVGGRVVDRSPNRRVLSLTVLTGGALLALTPAIARPVLSFTEGIGPRIGPLLAATLLFAPTLTALGMAGPMAVRLATSDLRATGRLVGIIYAVSTVGSLAGTLVTGFVLIPALETSHILLGTALLLVLVGAVPLALRGRPRALVAVFIPFLGLAAPTQALPPGIKVLDRAHSPYGLVEVIEDENRGVRLLRADHSIIGGQATIDGSTVFSFLHLLESVRFLRPQAKDLLQIGLGVGSVPTALRPFGFRTDSVEIDPAVASFAAKYFRFVADGDVAVEDARTFLNRTDRRYDVIIHDTFTGGATPEHLLSLEAIQTLRRVLRPGGVLALNFVGYPDGPKAAASHAVVRTLRAVFPTVRAFRDDSGGPSPESLANLVFFASEGRLDFTVPESARFENEICRRVLRSFQEWEVLKSVPPGEVVTDARNFLARLQLPISDEHSRAMREILPSSVWLRF
jgi:SAM-dependent methyltransferase